MFLQDLYLLAFDCAEVRTSFLHLRNQVFKKGFDDWKPNFKLKCLNPKCGKEFQEEVDKCDKCHGDKFREPDTDQYIDFDKFRTKCNIFGNSLEEVLKTCEDDVNICLVPGTLVYRQDGKKGQGYQVIETIKAGDKVYTHQGRVRKVLKTYQRFVNEDLVVLNLENGEVIKVTENHPIYAKRGWIHANELNLDDILYKLSDFKKFSNNMTSEERHEKCCKPSGETRRGKRRGKYDCVSPRKGLSLVEYLGIEKARERELRWKETLLKNGSNKGFGFNFRAKRGSFIGENNPNWHEGASKFSYGFEFNAELKRKIFRRDKFTCQNCGKYPVNNLVTHHIDYDKRNSSETNLISVCKSCNLKANFNRDYWQELFSDIIAQKLVVISNGTKIISISKEHYEGYVYNLEVEEDNSYCGKGIIYHNCDDFYLYLNTQYKKVDKLYGQVIEIRRIHPALVEFDLDKNGIPKNSHWICLFHRDIIYTEGGVCRECKENLVPVMYVYNHRGRRLYVTESEIIHTSKFSPSETYGYAALLTIMQKVLTLSGMDRFLYRYFFERKAPTGMILTYTDDPQSLEVERARVESKMMEDPTYMPWVAVSQKTGRGRTDFVRLFHTLHEMDYIPVRNEIRDRISAMYGVPQMYMNVMEGVGGISGQTQQLKVFSDVIQADQRMYNEKVFPILLKAFGITDWKLQLRPPEEKVEGEILQLATQKVNIASQMRMMGFDIELKPECKDISTLDFTFSGKAQPMAGPMGGMFGGGEGMPIPTEEPAESGESQEGPVWNRKIPAEEEAFDTKGSTEEFDEESSDQEHKVFNVNG